MSILKISIIIFGFGIWQCFLSEFGFKLTKPCIFTPIISTIVLLEWQPFFREGSLSEFIFVLVVGVTLAIIAMVITDYFKKET